MRRLIPQLLIPLVGLALLAAACGSGTGDEGRADPRDVTSDADPTTDGDETTGSTVGGTADAGDDIDGTVDEPADTPAVVDDGIVASIEAPWEGACTIDQVALGTPYAVTGIPTDDPDGGLNLRTGPGDGEVVNVLPEAELVRAVDCIEHDDGGVWWLVETRDLESGFVNAAFLTDDLSASDLSPRAASAAEERVEWLLGSLDVEAWDDAAAAIGSGGVFELATDVDRGVRPEALAEWCETFLCDAGWTIVGTTGTYAGGWDRPTVDVRFDYPGGPVVQTFGLVLEPEAGTSTDTLEGWRVAGIDGLPGWSSAALRTDDTPQALDAAAPADGDELVAAAERVRAALVSESGPRLPADLMAPEGVVLSLDANVSPEPAERVSVTAGDLAERGDQTVLWGFADGTGFPIVETLDERLAQYRRSLALLIPDEVAVDRAIGRSNTVANLDEVFPDARVVEFHRTGRGDLSDFNWSSVRMAFEPRGDGWTLVAITADTWTI